jgi:hypothetical protein
LQRHICVANLQQIVRLWAKCVRLVAREAAASAADVSLQDLTPAARAPTREALVATIEPAMADQTPTISLDQQLQEIGAQLAWVRDYL